MKVIVVYKHYSRDTCILGVYTDKNRAKRSATEQGFDPDKVKYIEFELNDGIKEEKNELSPLSNN